MWPSQNIYRFFGATVTAGFAAAGPGTAGLVAEVFVSEVLRVSVTAGALHNATTFSLEHMKLNISHNLYLLDLSSCLRPDAVLFLAACP